MNSNKGIKLRICYQVHTDFTSERNFNVNLYTCQNLFLYRKENTQEFFIGTSKICSYIESVLIWSVLVQNVVKYCIAILFGRDF